MARHALPSLVDRVEPTLRVVATVLEALTAAGTAGLVLWLFIYALAGGTL